MLNRLYEKIYFLEHEEMIQTSFSLYLECIEVDSPEDSFYWIKSDIIPREMLIQFEELISPRLIFKKRFRDPDLNYVEELLDFVSQQILQDTAYRSFFYPNFFFDIEQNLRLDIVKKFERARVDVRNAVITIINRNYPLHLFYIDQLIRIPKYFLSEDRYSVVRITREIFETSLSNAFKAEEYIDIYFASKRFKLIRNKNKEALYYIALNSKNKPILVIKVEDEDSITEYQIL
jgi:hypothetical protein